jgi:hypothetical protein
MIAGEEFAGRTGFAFSGGQRQKTVAPLRGEKALTRKIGIRALNTGRCGGNLLWMRSRP